MVTFAGVALKNWQTPKGIKTRPCKETELLSENTHVTRSSKVIQFPKIFQCYVDSDSELADVEALILDDFSTLAINGTNYSNCYVYQISEIWEVKEGSGIWTYSIEFRQADVH